MNEKPKQCRIDFRNQNNAENNFYETLNNRVFSQASD